VKPKLSIIFDPYQEYAIGLALAAQGTGPVIQWLGQGGPS
jgi:hypothetical protein